MTRGASKENELAVVCPSCGHEFSLTETLKDKLQSELDTRLAKEREGMRIEIELSERKKFETALAKEREKTKDAEDAARKDEREKAKKELQSSQQQVKEMESKLQQASVKEEEMLKKQRELELKEKQIPLEVQRGIEAQRKEWEKRVGEVIKENYEGKVKTLEITIERQNKALQEMQTKLNQGSQELQGEIQEVAIEEALKSMFPNDFIKPVPRGVKGADIIQTVINSSGETIGIIVWESKKTKHWQDKFIDKLVNDRDSAKGDVGIVVSDVLPEGVNGVGIKRGVIVCSFQFLPSVAEFTRSYLFREYSLKASNKNRSTKEGILYNFILSNEFKGFMEGAFLPVANAIGDINKEKAVMERTWKKRETQLKTSLANIISLYGNISGIAELPELPVFSTTSNDLEALPDWKNSKNAKDDNE